MLIIHPILNKIAKILYFQSKIYIKVILELIITFLKVLDWKSEIFVALFSVGHKISIF